MTLLVTLRDCKASLLRLFQIERKGNSRISVFIRPIKQEIEFPFASFPDTARLPIKGDVLNVGDIMRRGLVAPTADNTEIDARARSGKYNSSGAIVETFASGKTATVPQQKFDVAREERSMKREVNALLEARPAIRELRMKKPPIQVQFPSDNRPAINPDDTAIIRKRVTLRAPRSAPENQEVTAVTPRSAIVVKPFIDPTIFAQQPYVQGITKDFEPYIGELIHSKHRGRYEEMNRIDNPDNTQFTGASYYFHRGDDALKDTSYKSYVPGPAFNASWVVPGNRAPSAAPLLTDTQHSARTMELGRETHNEKNIYPNLYQKQQEFTRQVDTTQADHPTIPIGKLWNEPRALEIPHYLGPAIEISAAEQLKMGW
jgi:hypothetical protein